MASPSVGPSKDYARPHTGGRTILSTGSYDGDDGFKAYSGLIVNGILYLLFFAWLLIKGEPRFPRDCKPLSLFATYMKKADIEMKKVTLLIYEYFCTLNTLFQGR